MEADADADADSAGCITCHTDSDAKTMHLSSAVKLGCVSCHGGDARVMATAGLDAKSAAYAALRGSGAHIGVGAASVAEIWRLNIPG